MAFTVLVMSQTGPEEASWSSSLRSLPILHTATKRLDVRHLPCAIVKEYFEAPLTAHITLSLGLQVHLVLRRHRQILTSSASSTLLALFAKHRARRLHRNRHRRHDFHRHLYRKYGCGRDKAV
jgi:hypothetical protein